MAFSRKQLLTTILIHILVWSLIIFILFIYPPMGRAKASFVKDFFIKQLVHMILMVSAYYINAYYLVPKILFKGKRFFFGLSLIGFILLSSFMLALVDGWFGIGEQLQQLGSKKMWSNPYIDFFGMLSTLFVLGISTSIAVVDNWSQETTKRGELEKQQIATELNFLRGQIHPHFFFNTLNTIYALTYTNVESSRKVLHQLSRMMRYLLYETKQEMAPLVNEIRFIQDYIEVMRLRLQSNTKIYCHLPTETVSLEIAPMLLLPYIENAFKHGIDDQNEHTILIELKLIPNGLRLLVENALVGRIGGLYEREGEQGIGMANTQRRLELLYHDRYQLDAGFDTERGIYRMELKLDLI